MEFNTIDEIEELFIGAMSSIIGEDRGIELQYLDGIAGDISTNIALKYKDGYEIAEKLRENLDRDGLGIEKIDISEKNHLNIFLSDIWQSRLIELYRERGLDIHRKEQKTLVLNPVSKSEQRVEGYKKAMKYIGQLKGIDIECSSDGETVALGDMVLEGEYPLEVSDIVAISRVNRTDVLDMEVSKSNNMSNPAFRWNYIDYRLQNIAEILQKQSATGSASILQKDPLIWKLLLTKLKSKKALEESIRFRDPYKYYRWREEYLDLFYSIRVSRETFTPRLASSLRLK